MDFFKNISKNKKKRKSALFSIAGHLLLFLLFLLPWLSYQDPPPEQEGVLVSFGNVDVGSGDNKPSTQLEEEIANPEPAENTEESQQETQKDVPEEEVEEQAPPTESSPKEEELLTSKEKAAIAAQKKKQEEARKKAEAEAEAKRKAAEEARKKAEEKAEKERKMKEAKKQFGSVFGSGRGKTNEPGNQGNPDGDPDAKKLEGISKGSGVVGGGLGNRGLRASPTINDRSQKAGRVVVNVCVDRSGKVVSANYTQRGSTTTDSELRDIAIKNARKFRFSESSIDKQCGTITIDFKLR